MPHDLSEVFTKLQQAVEADEPAFTVGAESAAAVCDAFATVYENVKDKTDKEAKAAAKSLRQASDAIRRLLVK